VTGSSLPVEPWLAELPEAFASEQVCANYLIKLRWPNGFVCRHCRDNRAWRLNVREATYQCRGCDLQTSITAGTMLHGSRLPLRVWFWGAHLAATSGVPLSVRQWQKCLKISYKAAWQLRRSLQLLTEEEEEEPQRLDDDGGPLAGLVEVNRTEILSRDHNTVLQRLELHKIVLAVALEVRSPGEETPFLPGRLRLAMIPDNSAPSIEAFVRANVKSGATLLTEGHKSFLGLTGYHFDRRAHGKPLPRTRQVLATVEGWLAKTDTRDGKAVDRVLDHYRAKHALEHPHTERRAPFEIVLRRALQHEPNPNSDQLWKTRTPGRGTPTARRTTRHRKAVIGMRQDGLGSAQSLATADC
jgi:hypothetical protein